VHHRFPQNLCGVYESLHVHVHGDDAQPDDENCENPSDASDEELGVSGVDVNGRSDPGSFRLEKHIHTHVSIWTGDHGCRCWA